ncbi:Microcystin-dependent protein [Pseudarcicella hirudinis]|uniref:Microcystin-dependent protein n=1 Tax=Pseudarcicella hirudinis TaxID=1079859 RepID=A0A1I5P7R3_9BACT|nr:tail fiber protein [Pseudarcicella hirudinis]SFP30138.1 Microcystin-dependent protein [Pseudarcicella hirudinis]
MGDQFLGEIRLFAGNFAPRGWALCQGQILAISTNTALFSILGTTYGGNGQTTFALPDLRGRVAISQGQGPGLTNYVLGEAAGVESVTLTLTQIPAHNHLIQASSLPATASSAQGNVLGTVNGTAGGDPITVNSYGTTADGTMNPNALSLTGGSLPHENRMPYLALNYIIATTGIFPSRN